MSGTAPDRVPFMCQMSIGHMLVQLGPSPADFWNDADVFAEGLCLLRERYGFDGILVSLHGHSPSWKENIGERSASKGAERIRWKDGSSTVYHRDDLPEHTPVEDIEIPNPTDEPPDGVSYIPVSQGLHFSIDQERPFDIFRLIRRRAGDGISIHGEVTSALDYYLDWLGHEQALMLLLDDPDRAKSILRHFAECVASLAGSMCDEDIDAVKISSPFAGAGFLSRAHYEEFVLPGEALVAGAIHDRGKHAYVHTCGAIGDRLDLLQRTGADGLECLDPPPLGTVELDRAFKELHGRSFVKGNIDSVTSLLQGSPEFIRKDARGRLKKGKAYGRFILSTACSIAPHVPADHILILKDLIEKEGLYGAMI